MPSDLDCLTEALRARRARGDRPDCLSDGTLEALADGSLSSPERTTARQHLDRCLACLHAYATLRRLLETFALEQEEIAQPPSPGRTVMIFKQTFATRVSLGWAVAGVAAAALLTWLMTSQLHRLPLALGRAPSVVELSDQPGQKSARISGIVLGIRDAGAEDLRAHVLEVQDAAGAVYSVFAWGPPTVRVGDAVVVDGLFSPLEASEGNPRYKGVASAVRRTR